MVVRQPFKSRDNRVAKTLRLKNDRFNPVLAQFVGKHGFIEVVHREDVTVNYRVFAAGE
jgi:hypothetical protein